MLDELKYDYIELDLPNIVTQWDKGKGQADLEFVIAKEVRDLIMQAAVKFPMWKFVSTHSWRRDGKDNITRMEAIRFSVYDGKEAIGHISTDHSRAHGQMYALTNDRIDRERARGSWTKTKDLNKALKIMGKLFGAKTIQERLDESDSACQSMLSHLSHMKGVHFRNSYSDFTAAMMGYLMNNWELTNKLAMDAGVDAKILEKLPGLHEDAVIAERIFTCYGQKKGAVVTIHGKDYAVKEKDCVTIYGTDDLPDWLKRGVGMLKLIESNQVIGGIGLKINEQSFFVVKENSDE